MSFQRMQQSLQNIMEFCEENEESSEEKKLQPNSIQRLLVRRDKVLKILYKWQSHAIAFHKEQSKEEVQEIISFIKDLT